MKNCIKNKKIEWVQLITLCIILFIDCALFNSGGYGIGRIFTLLIIFGSLFLNIEKLLFLIIFCLPFSGVLKLSENSITIMPILYLIATFKLIIQSEEKYDLNGILAIGGVFFLQILSCIIYGAQLISSIAFLLSAIFVFLIGKKLSKQVWEEGYLLKNIALFFVVAVCLETISADAFPRVPYYISLEKHLVALSGNRFAALSIDPNEYAQHVLIALGLIVAVFPVIKNPFVKFSCIPPIIFLGYKGFLTYSKSYALTLLVLFVILAGIFLFKFVKNRGKEALILIIPLCLITILGGYLIYQNILQAIFEKRSDTELLSGRGDVWRYYITQILYRFDCLLLGCGASNTLYIVRGLTEYVPHNLYIEYLVQFGLIGLVSLYFIFKESIKGIIEKTGTYMMLPILLFLITSLGISANANDTIFFILVIACIPYYQKSENRRGMNDKNKN